MALFGCRVFEGSLQSVFRQMSLLLHPDKRPSDAGDSDLFVDGFQKLGQLYERVSLLPRSTLVSAKSLPWRFAAEQELLCAVRAAKGRPPPTAAPLPPKPKEDAREKAPGPVLRLVEWINLEAPRQAQELLAMRTLRIGGDAGRSWASAVDEYLSKACNRQFHQGTSIGCFDTAYWATERQEEMKLDGRLQSGLHDPDQRSVFGLPSVLTSLFRIGLPLANLDQKSAHFVSIMDLIKDLGMRPEDFPDCNGVAYDKAAWLAHIADHAFFEGKGAEDIKIALLSIAYLCRKNEAWPQAMQDLHDQISAIVLEHARQHPDRVKTARSWGKRRPEVTAFSYALCSYERSDVNRQLAAPAAADAAMSYEFDGLFFLTATLPN